MGASAFIIFPTKKNSAHSSFDCHLSLFLTALVIESTRESFRERSSLFLVCSPVPDFRTRDAEIALRPGCKDQRSACDPNLSFWKKISILALVLIIDSPYTLLSPDLPFFMIAIGNRHFSALKFRIPHRPSLSSIN